MQTDTIYRYCYRASIILFIGILLSGLPGNLLVNAWYPQPPWRDIETYAAHFHPLQLLPIWAGFLMIIGFIGLVAGIHYIVAKKYIYLTFLAVVAASIYGALISLNYMLQLAVLQPAIIHKQPEGMAHLAFGNPHSLTMAIEMLGYGFQGAATWLIGYAMDSSPLGKWIKYTGIVNGIVSISGVIIQGLSIPMSIDQPLGVVAFVGWNLLFTLLCLLYLLYFHKKVKAKTANAQKHRVSHSY